jgi:hypothetical protein
MTGNPVRGNPGPAPEVPLIPAHNSSADYDDLDRIRGRVAHFENIIERAQRSQFAADPPHLAAAFLQHDPILAWRLLDLFDAYSSSSAYPLGRLPPVIDHAIDTKLQLYNVARVIPGTENALVYLRGFDPADPVAAPRLQLARLCYEQAMIGQSRVLWDRLMRLIYYLEEGVDPKGKSTRRVFFRDLPRWSMRWDALGEWEDEIDTYDATYRTPEYHKGSILKKELLGGPAHDPNETSALLTPVMNGIWTMLMANVQGISHNIIRLGRRVGRVTASAPPAPSSAAPDQRT